MVGLRLTTTMKIGEKMKQHDLLVYLTIKYDGDWDKIYNHIKNKVWLDKEDMRKTLAKVDLSDFVTLVDEDYPDKYKTLRKPYFAYRKQSYLDYLQKEKKKCVSEYRKEITKLKKEHERKINDLSKKIGGLKC